MQTFVIKILDVAGAVIGAFVGKGGSVVGQYVVSYNPDAHGGRGEVAGSMDIAQARRFNTVHDAMAFWRQTSTVLPVREDGKPNRPLTALTVTVEPFIPEPKCARCGGGGFLGGLHTSGPEQVPCPECCPEEYEDEESDEEGCPVCGRSEAHTHEEGAP
jgi:hypothetical protein